MLLESGQVIDGKYRIVRLIGTGGMGAVYEGENVLIRRRVAIKVLNADSATNTDVIRRFEREAQAAGEIGNDHILEVLDIGSLVNGDRYMVMEYLDGETLAARIERHGRLTPQQVAPIARQFLTALASAHAAGIIHRDLKPENIFILRSKAGRADFVKLIDFGISKFSRSYKEGDLKMTRADAVLGTPCYMSPEQARGAAETDVRSDIYSCGVILFESVTGRLPFEGSSFNDLMFKIALEDAPSPLTYEAGLDPDFAWIVNRAIARDPTNRFATAQDFAEALDEWMRKNALTGTLALPQPPDAFPPRVAKNSPTLSLDDEIDSLALQKTGTTEESWARSRPETPTRQTRRRRGAIAIAGSVVGLSVVCIGIALVVRTGSAPSPPAAPARPLPTAATQATVLGSLPTLDPPPSASSPASSASAPLPAPRALAKPGAVPALTPPLPAPRPTPPADKPKPKPASSGFDLGY